jgi:acetylornithine deacetylase
LWLCALRPGGVRRYLLGIGKLMTALTDLLASLVSIDSTNPDLVPGAAGESKIAHFVAGWLEQQGLDVQIVDSVPGRPNVIAAAKGRGGGKSLLLNGHMDTVGAGGMLEAHTPRIEDGRMYGRGAYDMKGGLAACMFAIAEAKKLGLRGDVTLTAVVDEEYASIGTQEIARQVHADGAIVAEFTELQLVLAHKGFAWFDVETNGIAAHGSRADLGVDAIAHMGRVLVELERYDASLGSDPPHPLLGTGSIHASVIRGGGEMSTYPDRCVLSVERRTLPGESADDVEQSLLGVLEHLQALDGAFRATIRRGLDRSPLETAADAGIARAVQTAATKLLGHPAPVTGVHFWSDAALLADAGIPSLLFGPSGAGAHAADEWVDLQSVETCAQVYLETAKEFCR